MIYAVGIDLSETERVRKALDIWGERFAEKILGDQELAIFRNKHNRVPFLSGRFAAKEAVIKALGEFVEKQVHFRQVQILNNSYGKPYVRLDGEVAEKIYGKSITVSITHERHMAAAVAIIFGD